MVIDKNPIHSRIRCYRQLLASASHFTLLMSEASLYKRAAEEMYGIDHS